MSFSSQSRSTSFRSKSAASSEPLTNGSTLTRGLLSVITACMNVMKARILLIVIFGRQPGQFFSHTLPM